MQKLYSKGATNSHTVWSIEIDNNISTWNSMEWINKQDTRINIVAQKYTRITQ
jgi:hypothetical protein